jgi:hypothetical protein
MRLRSWTTAPLLPAPKPFEMMRDVVAVMDPSTPSIARSREVFAAARLHCQRGGRSQRGTECLACERLVSVCPSRGGRTVTVRCLWTDRDLVASLMALPPRVPHVDHRATLARGAAIAREARCHHLLVTDGDDVVGTACECMFLEPDALVGDRMIPHVWTLPTTATLGQAVEAMLDLEVGMLVVADRDQVLGVVTGDDVDLDHSDVPHVH